MIIVAGDRVISAAEAANFNRYHPRLLRSSNLVTPTKLSRDSRTFVLLSFFVVKASGNNENNGNYGIANKTLCVAIKFFGFRGYPRRGYK